MRPRGAYRQEMVLRRKLYRSLQKQHTFLIEHSEELYQQYYLFIFERYGKGFQSLDDFWKQMGLYDMIHAIRKNIEKLVQIGYKQSYRLHKNDMLRYDFDFNVQNPYVTNYVNEFMRLQLSDYKGSIPLATKNKVVQILKDGITNNLRYDDIAPQIVALDTTLFSQNRAKLIAVREMGQAYEFGNYIPMKQLNDAGVVVQKKRLTVGDERVTEECSENERQGRVPFNHVYMYDSDDIAPRGNNPRCRCSMQWKIS